MRLNFLLQFETYQNKFAQDTLVKLENERVMVEGVAVADLNNIPFAARNSDYTKLRDGISKLDREIEKLRLRIAKYPEDKEEFERDLQEKLNERNAMSDEFEKNQTALFQTALTITKLSGERISERMARAIAAFEDGRMSEANAILAEAEHDVAQIRENYKRLKTMTAQERQNLILSIEELRLKTDVAIGDGAYTIEERIAQAERAFAEAVESACEADYDQDKFNSLLFDYAWFLDKYARYDQALTIDKEQIVLAEAIDGPEHPDTVVVLNNMAYSYNCLGEYDKAIECGLLAVGMDVEYKNPHKHIAMAYEKKGDRERALHHYRRGAELGHEYCQKWLETDGYN